MKQLRSWLNIAGLLCLLGMAGTALAQANPAMAWPQVRQKVETHWKSTYPAEKVLKVEQKGPLQYYSTQRSTDMSQIWGWIWETRTIETQGAFARQVALVSAERPNKTQARFEVAALFKREGGAWQFNGVAVGKVEELSAAKAKNLPSNDDAVGIFKQAWAKHRPDFTLHSIAVLGAEPKQYQERRWINYKLAIEATGTDKGSRAMYNKKYRCTPADHSSVLKWDDAANAWVADEGMIRNINEAGDCKPAP